ncbi:hypothetical protein [Erythrobacter sp.]|uniref:hypothetical protein n=1 Tax=Erythrobacter sp. TaxID=1042 RepID=UPI001B165D82|nr:hypothetical protein [Erythrobacter sp.]MBO6525680.1 hypothetical protein [Erythrobacter sp.]MBO6529646.1 hypothetical protein [Erythrobacter sp.]
MTPTEEAILRGIEEKLISFADWRNSWDDPCEADRCCRDAQYEMGQSGESQSLMLANFPCGAGWDMLISLFVMHANGRTASIASSCRAGGVSRAAGSRFIEALAEEGITVVEGEREDGGARPVCLSERGRQLVEKAMQNFIRSRSEDSLDSARRSIAHAITNNRIAQEMSISLRSIELHRANMAGRRS